MARLIIERDVRESEKFAKTSIGPALRAIFFAL